MKMSTGDKQEKPTPEQIDFVSFFGGWAQSNSSSTFIPLCSELAHNSHTRLDLKLTQWSIILA
jgi:hypothetical protein